MASDPYSAAVCRPGPVRLERELPVGTPVVLLGHGVLAESHARVAGTINYELTCGVETGPLRARRTVIDA